MLQRFRTSYAVIGLKLVAAIAATEFIIMLIFRLINIGSQMGPLLIGFLDTLILSIAAPVIILLKEAVKL